MKKFLFTLIALLMAGSLYAADNYLYIEDFEITEDSYMEGLINADGEEFTGILVPVAAHFDQYASGWQIALTMPEGLTVKNFMTGDAATISYKNNLGQTKSLEASITPKPGFLEFVGITTAATQGYWKPEGSTKWEAYGVVKWDPGDYADMFYLMIEVDPSFTGGNIIVHTEASSGSDTRGNYITEVIPYDDTCKVTVKQPETQPAPAATITSNGNVVTAAVPDEEPGTHFVELYIINGNDTTKVDSNPYTVPQTYEEQKIVFIAKTIANDDESKDTWSAPMEVTIPAKQKEAVDAPTVEGEANENAWQYNIVITPNGDGELKYTVTDAEGNTVTPKETIVDEETGVVTLVFDKGNEAVTVHVEAYTAEGATCAESETTKEDIVIPALDKVATPEITWKVNDDNTITITATSATEGATVVLIGPDGTQYTTGTATVEYDPYAGYSKTWTATATKEHMQDATPGEQLVTVEAINKKDAVKPTIVGQKREGSKKLFDIIITPDANTDGKLEYTANPMGTVVGAKAEPVTIQYERGEEDYYVDVTAYTKEGPTYNASETAEARITVPKLDQVAEPKIEYVVNGDKITITASTTDGADVVLIGPDGTEYPNGTTTVDFDPYEGYDKTWTATASAEDMLPNSTEKEVKVDALKVLELPDPTIDVDKTDPNKTVITIEVPEDAPEGTVLTATVTDEAGNVTTYTDDDNDGKIVIEIANGDETAFVDVVATTTLTEVPEGYDEVKPGLNTKENVEIPAKPEVEQTAKPIINVTTGTSEFDDDGNVIVDGHWKEVTFEMPEGEDANAVIEYYVGDDPENGTWVEWDGLPLNYKDNGTYHVWARATANGKETSELNDVTVVVDAATGVNELVNGKAVAGVRYFNMAGQEMQEANGITIVVTTYTDGTTSAVKVIK